MTTAVPDILARIIEQKKREIAGREGSVQALEKQAATVVHRDFAAALASGAVAIIAEIKQASPSKGILVRNFDPASIARLYETGGAAALSVLTDGPNFRGSLADLVAARSATRLPALRKDFTISRLQIAEAAAAGADAILLIAAILSDSELSDYRTYAEKLGLAALIEVHDEQELDRAIASGARIIGVNNRDLRTFEVTVEISERLAAKMPSHVIRVSESGINSGGDIVRLRAAGYSAFLVGEHLMRSGDPARAIAELRG